MADRNGFEISALESCSTSAGVCAQVTERKHICGQSDQGSFYSMISSCFHDKFLFSFLVSYSFCGVCASKMFSLHFKHSLTFAEKCGLVRVVAGKLHLHCV